jgi:hypothetical protein
MPSNLRSNMEHYLQYIMELTAEHAVVVRENGDIELDAQQNIIDIYDTRLYCTACAKSNLDLYEFHKVSDQYDVF